MADDSTFSAFDRNSVLLFVAVEIELPAGGALRLLDGSGSVSFDGRTFVGLDPELGVLANLEAISDGFGDEAPGLRIGINPPTAEAAASLAGQDMQGRSVMLWLGALNPANGQPWAAPGLVFVGDVDQGILSVGLGTRGLTLDCVSVWERLFEDLEGVRLTNSFHQNAWPGELGLEFVTDIQRQLPWGSDAPRPAVIRDAIYTRPNQ